MSAASPIIDVREPDESHPYEPGRANRPASPTLIMKLWDMPLALDVDRTVDAGTGRPWNHHGDGPARAPCTTVPAAEPCEEIVVTEPIRPDDLRVSDVERARVQDLLSRAHDVGQLDLYEFDERVRTAWLPAPAVSCSTSPPTCPHRPPPCRAAVRCSPRPGAARRCAS